jgi:hypothetical protein
MSELVNSSSKSQLSSRNAEPSHLSGAAYDDLGGPTWDHKGGPDAYKIDATKSAKGQDATIPKAVGSEPTHLKTSGVNEDEKVDVDFDGDKEDIKEADDLDKELDKFDDIKEADVEIEVDDEDDKKLKEDVKEVPDAQAKGAETTTDQTDPYVKEDNDDHEGQEGTKLSLSDVQEDDDSEKKDDDKEDLKEGDLPPWLKKDGDKDKGDDDKDKKVDEDEEKDDDKDKIEESVKIRIKLPAAPLFESVNPKARKQVAVIYEQALRATTKQIAEQMQKHYQAKHRKLVEARDRVMAKQVDSYLNYVVEEWSKQNIVPIRQNLRASLAEQFMDKLKAVFTESYIDVPESKVDVVKQLTNKVNSLNKKLNEAHSRSMKLHRLAEAANKQRIVAQFGRGLTESQVAKLAKLTEDTPYTNAKDFRTKLTMLKESYFGDGKKDLSEKHLPEGELKEEKKTTTGNSEVDIVAATLSRQARSDKW